MRSRITKNLVRGGLGRSLVFAAGGTAGVSIVGMAFTFLLGWQLARGLGAAGYGVYGVALAIISMLGVPSQFGLPQLLTREVASSGALQDWARMKGVMRWSLKASGLSSLAIILSLGLWLGVMGPGLESQLGKTLAVGSILIPLLAWGALSAGVLRGLLFVVVAQIPESLVRPGAHALLLVVLAVLGVVLTPVTAMAAGAIAAAIALIVGAAMAIRSVPREAIVAQHNELPMTWIRAALPMALTEGLRVVQGQVAIIALGAMVNMAQVGQFRVAASVMTILVLPITVLNLVTSPHISRLAAVGEWRKLERMLSYASLGMTLLFGLLALPFVVSGNWIITVVFGIEYDGANTIMLVLSLGVLSNAVFGVGANALNMLGYPSRVTRASIVSVLTLCAVLVPAVDSWGGLGAAAAVSATMTLWSAMLWWDVRRLTGIDIAIWSAIAIESGNKGRDPL